VPDRDPPGVAAGRELAYLVSQYPALSMAWLLREVAGLRRLGFRIEVASINGSARAGAALTGAEAEEAASTFYVKAQGISGALRAHVACLAGNPGGYLRGLRLVFSLSPTDVRRTALNLAYFTEALLIGPWMRRRGLAHLHVHLGSQGATVGLFVRRICGTGLSITFHGPDEFYDAPGFYLTEKVVAADFIVCISHFARSQLMRLSPAACWHKLVVSRLGVDVGRFSPSDEARDAGGAFRILCIGRLVPSKGQHLLVAAVERLVARGVDVRLELVGDGPDRESLQREAAERGVAGNVVFHGAVNQDGIRSLYAQADCFCLPSFAEGIPVVLMEAMACGVPCVTTHITGVPELIASGEDGLLVAPSDVDGLVEAIVRLQADPNLRARLGAAGRQRVVAEYELEQSVSRLAEVFRGRVPTP
jgi:colanic acid/amylovoran biosynthesis glycosyltransferase